MTPEQQAKINTLLDNEFGPGVVSLVLTPEGEHPYALRFEDDNPDGVTIEKATGIVWTVVPSVWHFDKATVG